MDRQHRFLARLVACALLACTVAAAQAAPKFQMPFPCGQKWVGSTWSGHSPAYAVDLNRGPKPDSDLGDTVVAAYGGTVTTSAYSTTTGYGHYIIISHGNGWQTLYAHLNKRSVAKGKTVKRGQKIGTVGRSSAKYNLSPHLHFEERYNGAVKKIKWNGSQIPYYAKKTYTSKNCSGGGGGSVTGTVKTTSGVNLNVRAGPSTSYAKVGSVASGSTVTIQCQKIGQSISGTYGTSKLWNRIGSGRFIPDAYTYTGSDGRVAPDC